MSHDAHNPTRETGDGRDPREMLDAYLDGMLQGAELATFERALATDPELKAEVEAQRSINASLSRMFHRAEPVALRAAPSMASATIAPPSASPPPPPPPAPPAPPAPPPRLKLAGTDAEAPKVEAKKGLMAKPISPWYGIAAVLAFAVLAGLYVGGVIDPTKWLGPPAPGLIGPEIVYERKKDTGFQPDHVCDSDAAFVKYTQDMLGEPLLISNTSAVQVVGWSSYEPVFSAGTLILMAKVDGKEVLVVMDKAENDRKIRLPKSSGLNDFSHVFGSVVMHEITPLATERVLPLVEQK